MAYVSLFNETCYSFNGASNRIDELVSSAKKDSCKVIGIADEFAHGILKFYKCCIKNEIKPIIGLNIKIESLREESSNLIVYAFNNEGYKNLCKLSSIQLTNENEYLFFNEIKKYSSGLICVIPGHTGDIVKCLLEEDTLGANEIYRKYLTIFNDVYLGIDLCDYEIQQKVAPIIYKMGKSVVLNRVSYLNKKGNFTKEVLTAIFDGTTISLTERDNDTLKIDNSFKSSKEIESIYSEYESAIKNTNVIADKCNVTIDTDTYKLPNYVNDKGIPSKEYLKFLCNKGLKRRLLQKNGDYDEYKKRLDYELNIIDKMGYNDYFLVVWDFVRFARVSGVLVGPGRGSAAGSLVSYTLGIVEVDPIEYSLLFERFLNPQRVSMPDIDLDFPDDKRDFVIDYVLKKYGKEYVSTIAAFGTFQARSAIRDSARVVSFSSDKLDRVLAHIPQFGVSVKEAIKSSPELARIYKNEEFADLLDIACSIEGLPRHISTHAAGIIISSVPITDLVACQNGLFNMYQTQFEASDIESVGLLKMDFLGLRNLTSIRNTLDLIKQNLNKDINIYKIPLDDKSTYDLLKRVETTGIFQLESKGMRKLVKDMQIDNLDDIAVCLALYRPGPMENIPSYIKRRFNKEKVTYIDETLRPILESTNGIMIYQEQVIKILCDYAGYTLAEADLLRRAISKKSEKLLNDERINFINKSVSNGKLKTDANKVYDYIVKFANYGFNKSHSVAYSVVSYWMAYLKANYSLYFMSVLLSSVSSSDKQVSNYVYESRRLKINVLPPSVNKSGFDFTVEDNSIRYSLRSIKNIGVAAANKIIENRGDTSYKSFLEFISRTSSFLGERIYTNLISSGALDEFNLTKSTMINDLPNVVNYVSMGYKFDNEEFSYELVPEFTHEELTKLEKEALGFNLMVHPVNNYEGYIKKHNLLSIINIDESYIGKQIRYVGLLSDVKLITTKNGNQMAFIVIEDSFVKIDCVMFPDTYEKYVEEIVINSIYLLKGKVDIRNEQLQVIVSDIHRLNS